MDNIFFERELRRYPKIINRELEKFFNKIKFSEEKNPLVEKELRILKSFCLSSGKRIRPIMAIMGFRSVSQKKEKEIFPLIISPELYHNYTLIHDDIYDEDTLRRGKLAPHSLLEGWFKKKYKKNVYSGRLYKNGSVRFGVVSGFIIGKILRTLVTLPILYSNISEKKKNEIFKLFEKLDISDSFGQTIDLFFEKEREITEKDYFQMVNLKTGGLFKTSLVLGAVLGEANESQKKYFRNYGENLAYAFQIKDDLLDLSIGGEKGRGKGSDIKQGKKTLLFIRALKKANLKDKKTLLRAIGKEKISEKEIGEVINIFYKTGAVAFCERTAEAKIKRAIFWLNWARPKFNPESRKFLESLAYFMLRRKK